MNNGQLKDLCLALLCAETQDEVVSALNGAGFWDDPDLWRYYGDVENNWGQSGNQQSLAEAALAEKIVNSVDARLINEALARGIDPKGTSAPRTIREAVSAFFDPQGRQGRESDGSINEWSDDQIREVAQGITLCATGARPTMNLTIADCGEGQSPRRLPDTILSLSRPNKMYIPFVQGQFNQGGTGALRFCGQHNLQLVVSRRNPTLLGLDPEDIDKRWGFTIVRRERPSDAKDGRRNSIYTYLAPVGVGSLHEARHGEILSFSASTLPLFPGKEGAFTRDSEYGTAIKLYDYQYIGERSNIIRGRNSLRPRLELLLPEIALPVRLYELRQNAAGKVLPQASRETTLIGLRRRLENSDNVEEESPIDIPFTPKGEKLSCQVYLFKPEGTATPSSDEDDEDDGTPKRKLGGIKSYRRREGVVFTRNGQTQGHLPRDYFKRDELKLKPLADDLLVFVDCDRLSDDVREDLFMPSRDRLADNAFKADLIDSLDQALRSDETLKQLRNKRQEERMSERMKDDRPLAEVLQSLIRSSPNLTQLLQLGQRIPAPFNTEPSGSSYETPFKGELFPTFFKLKGLEYGKKLKRDCPVNQRMKLTFETDARDDYFKRRIEPGNFTIGVSQPPDVTEPLSYVGPKLRRGVATVMLSLPEGASVGDAYSFTIRAVDSRSAFENVVDATVRPSAETPPPGKPGTRGTPDKKPGRDREAPRQLATPTITPVYREKWAEQKPPFDEFTALRVEVVGYGDDERELYEFKVNMDNTPLLNEIKQRRLDDTPARNQFLYANVLLGLSLLLQDKQVPGATESGDETKRERVEERIEKTTRAIAPFLLAMTQLGMADLADTDGVDGLEAVG